jgi:hypothetical protein
VKKLERKWTGWGYGRDFLRWEFSGERPCSQSSTFVPFLFAVPSLFAIANRIASMPVTR